jgi:hypothetical protein
MLLYTSINHWTEKDTEEREYNTRTRNPDGAFAPPILSSTPELTVLHMRVCEQVIIMPAYRAVVPLYCRLTQSIQPTWWFHVATISAIRQPFEVQKKVKRDGVAKSESVQPRLRRRQPTNPSLANFLFSCTAKRPIRLLIQSASSKSTPEQSAIGAIKLLR